jgi:geranylgeranyl pyrophosphate synthase
MAFDLTSYLGELRRRVDESLREYLPAPTKPDPLRLREAMHKAVLAGGKRLRPCVAIAAAQAVGGTVEQALAPACAVEMIHAYSLVHDDLPAMDDDDTRRGEPTCHKAFGEATAILVGDALATQAFELLAAEGIRRPNAASGMLRASFELAKAAGVRGMVGGQALDIEIKDTDPGFETLELCHSDKTAALFCGASTIGALVGGGSEQQVEQLREYGFDLGLAFQHAEDLRDADFPQYEKRSLQRTEELALRATKVAAAFGEAGIPLVSLAKLVLERAQEVTQ